MIKSRLFVVDSNSIEKAKRTNIASINVPKLTGKYWVKTVSDIMADMLQIEIGDYIFFWEVKSGTQKSRIHGVYRAISKPYYSCDNVSDKAPFKICIEEAYVFENPIEEYDFLNCPYIKDTLWTVIGKKVAGKSRGTSPLSLEEAKHLITLLIGLNPNYTYIPYDDSRVINISNPLSVDYLQKGRNLSSASIYTMDPNTLNFINNENNVHYEKMLETIFNQEMSGRNPEFFSQFGIDVDKVIWFSNYLPYSIEQSEMDYVILESDDKCFLTKIYVIEFIKSGLDETHIKRSLLYSKWINDTLALGACVAQPIIICKSSVNFIKGETAPSKLKKMNSLNKYSQDLETEFKVKKLKVYTYDFSGDSPTFCQKR